MINRQAEPPISNPDTLAFREVEKITLRKNVPLYILNAGTQELCKIELVFKAGELYSRFPLVATAVNDLLDSGTKSKTAFEIAEAFDYYGAYLQTESTTDYACIKLYTLNKHLKNTLPLLKEVLSEAVFPEDELETYKQQNYQRLKINREKVDYIARKAFFSGIFRTGHPYGYYLTEEIYSNLSSKELQSFYQNSYSLNNAFILVSGKFSSEDLAEIERQFNGYSAADEPGVKVIFSDPAIISLPERKLKIEKQDAMQSAIRIGKSWHDKTHPDFHKMIVVTTVLGGYFGSRLMKNIREDKGYTYGIGCSLGSFLQSGFISISTQVGREVCNAALDEIYKEIEKLRTDLLPEEELVLVRNYLFGTFQRSIDGPFALADKFKNIEVFGLGYSYYHNYLHLLKNITPEMLLLTAREHLSQEGLFEVVTG